MNLRRFREYIHNLYFLNPNGFHVVFVILLSTSTIAIFSSLSTNQNGIKTPELAQEASTLIPNDHSLIPIDLINQEAISAVIENFGWIDLYSVNQKFEDYKIGKKIVKKIRILRAPLDPNQFGIIVPNEFVDPILISGPNYFATINKNKHHISQLMIYQNKAKKVLYGDQF